MQNYRYLYDAFRFFHFSFGAIRYNMVSCIEEPFKDRNKMLEFNNLSRFSSIWF